MTILTEVKQVSKHCHFQGGDLCRGPLFHAHSHLLVVVALVYWEQCLWLQWCPKSQSLLCVAFSQ